MRKQRNVVMLPTEKANLTLTDNGFLFKQFEVKYGRPQHLYFTAPSIEEDKVNGEEIKDKDWVIITVNDDIRIKYLLQVTIVEKKQIYCSYKEERKFTTDYYSWEKVIATTNPELWIRYRKDSEYITTAITGVPKIPTDFIEVFVKEQGKIEKVDVEYEELESLPVQYRPKLNNNGAVKVFPIDKRITKEEMLLNMQYYMEYCQRHEYVTPVKWLNEVKHY